MALHGAIGAVGGNLSGGAGAMTSAALADADQGAALKTRLAASRITDPTIANRYKRHT